LTPEAARFIQQIIESDEQHRFKGQREWLEEIAQLSNQLARKKEAEA